MLKILQARLQQYMNCELPDVQAGFRKGVCLFCLQSATLCGSSEPEIKLPISTHCIIEKAREFQKNIYFCFIDYIKVFDCVNHYKLWEIIKDIEIPEHLTCGG